MSDPHKILGVPRNASQSAIKLAFIALAKKHHPDTSTSEAAPEEFKRAKEAYDALRDSRSRAAEGLSAHADVTAPSFQRRVSEFDRRFRTASYRRMIRNARTAGQFASQPQAMLIAVPLLLLVRFSKSSHDYLLHSF